DDQAIFRWSGADIDYFINLATIPDYRVKVLHKSYRLPKEVYDLSVKVSTEIKHRNNKAFKPTKERGQVEYCNSLDDIDMDTGEWLILVRNVFLATNILEYIRISGYSYKGFGDVPMEAESLKAALGWEKLRKGLKITVKEARTVLLYASRHKVQGNARNALLGRDSDILVDMVDLTEWCGILEPNEIWHKALDKISVEDREYYIAARRKGETLIGDPRIKISTIHGAKGGEAENVVLFTDISARTYNGMIENYDDEARVFYVGITRAKKCLFIMQPTTPYYFTL
ncbi:ATP-dependent helicase, partial [Candidatus Pacearchaeota archaeon]|nr:ATP-dependent helicase [Candidatus Pacearchaeota archaeon]